MTPRQTLLALAALATTLSLSGFILEYGFNVLPCHMCWWQRYMHYAILAFSLLGLTAHRYHRSPALPLTGITVAAFTGLAIAVWQFAAQHGWLPFPASCTSAGMPTYASGANLLAAMNTTKVIPCDKETFTLLGLSLAAWNIPATLLTLTLSVAPLVRKPIK